MGAAAAVGETESGLLAAATAAAAAEWSILRRVRKRTRSRWKPTPQVTLATKRTQVVGRAGPGPGPPVRRTIPGPTRIRGGGGGSVLTSKTVVKLEDKSNPGVIRRSPGPGPGRARAGGRQAGGGIFSGWRMMAVSTLPPVALLYKRCWCVCARVRACVLVCVCMCVLVCVCVCVHLPFALLYKRGWCGDGEMRRLR